MMETTGTANGAGHSEQEPIRSTQAPLYRHPTHRLLGGVCGGLADYLGIDASLVRILWVVLTFGTAGAGFLAYLALWLLLPVGTVHTGQQAPPALEINERNISRAGLVLVILGGLWLLANLGVLPWLWVAFWRVVGLLFWPALLMGVGLLLLNNRQDIRESIARFRNRMRGSVQEGAERVKSRVHVDGETVKSGLEKTRRAIPLKRSRTDRIFLGVCGGIGKALGIDANLVRLIWAAFSIGSLGAGTLVYVVVGLLLPEEEPTSITGYVDQEPQEVQIIDGSLG